MAEQHGLTRGLGLVEATALNMSNMVGVGPFVTIPLLIGAMGGPQCLLGWAVGTVLALCDGLVWAELAAAMPGEGGSYLYLREAFRRTRLGTLLPFLFIWQFIFSGPLEIASGYIGFAQYLGYFRTGMGAWETRLAVLVVGVLVIVLLYRGIQSVGRLTVVLWIGMLATVAWIVVAGLRALRCPARLRFSAARVHDFAGLHGWTGRRHSDRDVQLSGLLRHLLRGRRGAAAGADHAALDRALGAAGGRHVRADDRGHYGGGAVAGSGAIEIRGGALHGDAVRSVGGAAR